MRNRIKGWIGLLLVLLLAAAAPAAPADTMHREVENAAIEMEAELGYDGMITYGKTIPLRVRVRNRGGDIEGALGINTYVDYNQYDRYEMDISLPAGAEKTFVLPVKIMRQQKTFTPEITAGGEVVRAVNISADTVANPSAMLIGAFSSRPRQLANLNINRENDTLFRYEYWQTVALTPDTFPDSEEMLNSFGMLVLDDIDPALLTAKQQETLFAWLENGHIVLSGGGTNAVRNTAFLGGLTGLAADGMETARTVLPALREVAGTSGNAAVPATLAGITGADPLIRDGDGRGLIWRSETGNGRVYTMAFEAGDAGLNADGAMHVLWQQILVKYDGSFYNTVLYPAGKNSAAVAFEGYELPVSVRSALPAGAVIAAAVPVLACVVWLLLKKKDRRRWMWVLIPALSLAAAAAVAAMAGSSELNRPMAVFSANILQARDGGTGRYTGLTVAEPGTEEFTVSMAGGTLGIEYYDSVWYDEEEKEQQEPSVLRTRYTEGEEDRLTLKPSQPWQLFNLSAISPADTGGRVSAEIWMQSDGLHASVTNGTAMKLKAGCVLTSFGYVSVPALAPGETADAVLLRARNSAPGAVPENGKMYTESGYSVISMLYYSLGLDENTAWQAAGLYGARRNMLEGVINQLSGGDYYSTNNAARFLYYAEPEEQDIPEVRVNNETVRSIGGLTVFSAEMNYLSVGKTGVVFHAQGMDTAVRVETDERGMPGAEMQLSQYARYYHNLNETPTFRFTLEKPSEVQVDRICLNMETWYTSQMTAYVLNAATREWEEIVLNKDIPDPVRYLDAEGNLYCRFRPLSYDNYTDIPLPTIQMEGRAANAAD